MPPYNDENMIMLVGRGAGRGAAASRRASSATAAPSTPRMARDRGAAVAAAGRLRETRARARRRLRRRAAWAATQTFAIIDAITSEAISPRFTDYAGSVQAVMAADTLLSALVNAGPGHRRRGDQRSAPTSTAPIARCAIPMPTIRGDFRASLGRAAAAIRRLR